MKTASIELRTKKDDAVETLLFWTAKELRAAAGLKVVIDSGEETQDYVVRREGGEVRVRLSPSFGMLRRNIFAESLRKVGVRLGLTHDFRSITQMQTIKRQQAVRKRFAQVLGVHPDPCPAQFLLRVDDFPSPGADSAMFMEFHKIAYAAGLPYLLAVTPFLDRANKPGLQEDEVKILQRCSDEGVDFALHGFTHERRTVSPASELQGMPDSELREKLDLAMRDLERNKIRVIAFVAPFNSYDQKTLSVLAKHFPVLCGGPESTDSAGYRGLSYLQGSLYVPSYRGAYDVGAKGLAGLQRISTAAEGLTVPLTVHWANEARDNFKTFRALCNRLKGRILAWRHFLEDAAR